MLALLSDSVRTINNTQPVSPAGVVLVSLLAGIRKNRSPTSKATVESVAKPGYSEKSADQPVTNPGSRVNQSTAIIMKRTKVTIS